MFDPMHVVESFGNLSRMCEMWSSAIKDRAFWHGIKCLHSYSAVHAWRNRKVCATSRRCAFGLIVSNRVNPYYKRHLDSNTVGTVITRSNVSCYHIHTVLQWQQQNINQALNSQNTMYHVQAMGCLLWGSGENYIVIIPSNCIWIFLNHSSLRSNDASVSYIIIGWDNGFSTARHQAII